ncbi:hypothetical protein AR158_C795R [Paramecium bursaria Chlorella virus AR158]|uniref:hypothetical protein n=1 Tax=Paramecium bursaria Chlorella virus AR158 TaxID=380598 RepID=UPI00015AA906|nr:hypothetical protein AR158_C795R [Paramecium bursaria Chlorella virus AR158]ABU44340.1 hypothetical protein AR158_C795R [Paramecium bursaria Chlorella virus AR158]
MHAKTSLSKNSLTSRKHWIGFNHSHDEFHSSQHRRRDRRIPSFLADTYTPHGHQSHNSSMLPLPILFHRVCVPGDSEFSDLRRAPSQTSVV